MDEKLKSAFMSGLMTVAKTGIDKYESFPVMSEWNAILSRLRCLSETLSCLHDEQPLPSTLCYTSAQIPFILNPDFGTKQTYYMTLYCDPQDKAKDSLLIESDVEYLLCGDYERKDKEIFSNLVKICYYDKMDNFLKSVDYTERKHKYVKLLPRDEETQPVLVPCPSVRSNPIFGSKIRLYSWQDAVDVNYGVLFNCQRLKDKLFTPSKELVEKLRNKPSEAEWTLKHDEQLIQFLNDQTNPSVYGLKFGSVTQYVDKIEVSSTIDYAEYAVANLTDDNPNTYWESDGREQGHWIKIYVKRNVVIDEIYISVDPSDDTYMPEVVEVSGSDLTKISWKLIEKTRIECSTANEVCVMSANSNHYQVFMIKIVECRDEGLDTRIRGIRLKSKYEFCADDLNIDMFSESSKLPDYHLIASFPTKKLYWRAVALKRCVTLLDSVLPYLLPMTDPLLSRGYEHLLSQCRVLCPLSRKRNGLIDSLLKRSTTKGMRNIPKVYINRRSAHGSKPDPETTVFWQIHNEIKRVKYCEKMVMDFRWSAECDQWWECVFIGEGVIDQGGGFRDTLCDISEELCPDYGKATKLNFFINTGDQQYFVPNPSCDNMVGFEWIGQLMGACVRSKENLVLTLSPMTWKQLIGQPINWEDFRLIDERQFSDLNRLNECQEEDEFVELLDLFSTDGLFIDSAVSLVNGDVMQILDQNLSLDNRLAFCDNAKSALLSQFDKQISALRRGLMSVLPSFVTQLLTWQCLEYRICGKPEISIAELRKSVHYEDVEESEKRVKYLWNILERFSHDERSKFLRFVCGRRRMPAQVFICAEKSDGAKDCLPESSTCSNTLYLPNYSSEEICENKLRYAVTHCVAIDADVQPWEE